MIPVVTKKITPQSKIFANGVHLQAFEVEINGKKQWRWLSVGFEDSIFFNGDEIGVFDYANSFEELLSKVD